MDDLIASVVAAAMDQAAQNVLSDHADGDIGDEDDFSSQLIGQLKAAIKGLEIEEIIWETTTLTEDEDGPPNPSIRLKGRHLTSKGKGSEEKKYGADIVFVLDVDIPGTRFTKGILVQAKFVNKSGDPVSKSERDRLKSQCEEMLDITPSSYVFTYSEDSLSVYSAAAIEAADATKLIKIRTWNAHTFFFDFLICWIGDPRIQATDRTSLAALRALVNARNAMLISAHSPQTKAAKG